MKINVNENGKILNTQIENREQLAKVLEYYFILAEEGIRKRGGEFPEGFIKRGIYIANDWTDAETDDYTGWYWIGVVKSPQTDSYILCFDYCGGGNMVTLGFDEFGTCEDYEKTDFIRRLINVVEGVAAFPLYIPTVDLEPETTCFHHLNH